MTSILQQIRQDRASTQEPGDEGILDAFACSDAWQDAWLRAIARAWEDPAFKDKLLTDAAVAFDMLGWTLPVGLSLNVRDYNGANAYEANEKTTDPDGNAVYVNGWSKMRGELAGEVTVILPPTPPAEQRAMALIDFQASGKVYPFTS
ncbi:MAG: BMA_0021/BMA_0022 family TOMM bacteriocin [Gammaproteobacteria bacterium]|nr:BMA_0021/BMA_0022 family TOMM bacteriocin [Gammaproteobacteria bacterium]